MNLPPDEQQHRMEPALEEGARVHLRELKPSDADEFLALMQDSAAFHNPWIQPPLNKAQFRLYLENFKRHDHISFAVCKKSSGDLIGVINLNHIIKGCVLQASLGYYAGIHYTGQGYLYEGMKCVIAVAFRGLKLHRLEAHIQPDNEASIKLVRRLGFQYEGLMPDFMYINNAWRDHERWVLIDWRTSLPPK